MTEDEVMRKIEEKISKIPKTLAIHEYIGECVAAMTEVVAEAVADKDDDAQARRTTEVLD